MMSGSGAAGQLGHPGVGHVKRCALMNFLFYVHDGCGVVGDTIRTQVLLDVGQMHEGPPWCALCTNKCG